MLDPKTSELIAIAASVVAKCQPCLEHHLSEARNAGASESDIGAAIKIAQAIRQAGDQHMDDYASDLLVGDSADEPQAGCSCGGACCE